MMSSCKYCIRAVASTKVVQKLVDKIVQLTSLLKTNKEDPVSSFLSNSHTCSVPTPVKFQPPSVNDSNIKD